MLTCVVIPESDLVSVCVGVWLPVWLFQHLSLCLIPDRIYLRLYEISKHLFEINDKEKDKKTGRKQKKSEKDR